MKLQSDLFDLINSLDKQEKRYFKIYASRHTIGEQNDYIKVFDELEKLDHYDEKALYESIKKEPFAKHISAVKNYLYHNLLEALKSYHSKKTISSTLCDYLETIELLYSKSLYIQCKKIIRKGKQLAAEYERYAAAIEFYSWEKKIIQAEKYAVAGVDKIKEIYTSEIKILDDLKNRLQYQKRSGLIRSALMQKGFSSNKEDKQALELFLKDPLFLDEKNAVSFDAKLTLYDTKIAIYELLGNRTAAINYAKKTIALMESNPNELKERVYNYVAAISNLMVVYMGTETSYDKTEELINKLSSFSVEPFCRTERIQLRIFYALSAAKSTLYYNRGETEHVEECIEEIKAGLHKYKSKIEVHTRLLFTYTIGLLYFTKGKYSEALVFINKIINKFEENVREDIQHFSRIMFLIIHFEKGNTDLLEYSLRNAVRAMKGRDKVYKYEICIVDFFRQKITKEKLERKDKKSFVELKQNLSDILKDPDERGVLSYFDILSWVDSKIENKPFAAIMRRKYLEANNKR